MPQVQERGLLEWCELLNELQEALSSDDNQNPYRFALLSTYADFSYHMLILDAVDCILPRLCWIFRGERTPAFREAFLERIRRLYIIFKEQPTQELLDAWRDDLDTLSFRICGENATVC